MRLLNPIEVVEEAYKGLDRRAFEMPLNPSALGLVNINSREGVDTVARYDSVKFIDRYPRGSWRIAIGRQFFVQDATTYRVGMVGFRSPDTVSEVALDRNSGGKKFARENTRFVISGTNFDRSSWIIAHGGGLSFTKDPVSNQLKELIGDEIENLRGENVDITVYEGSAPEILLDGLIEALKEPESTAQDKA